MNICKRNRINLLKTSYIVVREVLHEVHKYMNDERRTNFKKSDQLCVQGSHERLG
jgi:hypothetical protein